MGDDELKDLKKAWSVPESDLRPPDGLEAMIAARLRRFRRGLVRTVAAEIGAAILIYVLALGLLAISPGRLQTFHVKIMVLCGIAAVFLLAYFFLSRVSGRSDGLARPAIESLRRTIERQARWIRIYEWTGWVSAVVIAAVLWADTAFRALPAGWKAGVTIYLAAWALLIRPGVRLLYGRRLAALEKEYREWMSG